MLTYRQILLDQPARFSIPGNSCMKHARLQAFTFSLGDFQGSRCVTINVLVDIPWIRCIRHNAYLPKSADVISSLWSSWQSILSAVPWQTVTCLTVGTTTRNALVKGPDYDCLKLRSSWNTWVKGTPHYRALVHFTTFIKLVNELYKNLEP